MRRVTLALRAGLTLVEALIAMLILLLGITSVMILFPAGVSQVRDAVLDTRCTLLAQSAFAIAKLKRLDDDPLLRQMTPVAGANFLQAPFDSSVLPTGQAAMSITAFNAYTNSPNFDDASMASGTDAKILGLLHPNFFPGGVGATNDGLPILIDPLWVEAANTTRAGIGFAGVINANGLSLFRQSQIIFGETPPSAGSDLCSSLGITFGATNPCFPRGIRVMTTSEAASIIDPGLRGAWARRWFNSPDDVQFRAEGVPGVIESPLRDDRATVDTKTAHLTYDPFADAPATSPLPFPLGPNPAAPTYKNGRATAVRYSQYSWAYLFQRPVDAVMTDPSTGLPTAVRLGATPTEKQAVLVFYRRNLTKPYVPGLAAFVDGDTRVTLRYQPGNRPPLRRGGWLCELTVFADAGNVFTIGDPRTDNFRNRRAFNFHRISDFEDTIGPDGLPVLAVTLDKAPAGYNPTARVVFPDTAPSNTPQAAPAIPIYVPVVVFDGLQEVYGPKGLWGVN